MTLEDKETSATKAELKAAFDLHRVCALFSLISAMPDPDVVGLVLQSHF